MSTDDVPDLLNAYWRLVRDELGDWAPLIARFAPVVNALQTGTVDQMTVQAHDLPFAPLLIALSLSLKGESAAANQVLEAARPSLIGDAVLNKPVAPEFSEDTIGQLRVQNRAAALASFLACCGGDEQALGIFNDLEGAGRRRSLWETYLIARSLLTVDAPAQAVSIALDGVNHLMERRRRLDSGALRLNFGGRVGAELLTIAAAAALRTDEPVEEKQRLALYLFELGRDPLLAEIIYTSTQAPIPILLRLGIIRQSWSAEAEAFQWRELIARRPTSPGVEYSRLDAKLAAAETAVRAAKSELRDKAPSLYSMFFMPGRSLLRSPVESTVAKDAQGKLPPDTCVIGYDIAGGDVIGWTMTREHVSLQPLTISAETLAMQAASVHRSCTEGTLSANPDLDLLANAILQFADDCIDASTRIMFVPSGPLRALPFAVLPWRGQPLVSTRTCSVLPGLALLGDPTTTPREADNKPTIAAFGNPSSMRWTTPAGDMVTAGALIHAEREAVAVSKLVGATAKCGPGATRDAVVTALESADIVHLATHAVFSSEAPLFSAFLLADGEQLSVVDLMALNSRCSLVVASACSTGEGHPTSGNDVLGISRGLLGCGASGAVVSLWPVDDEKTADLMIAFYDRLLHGMHPANALCAAQRDSLTVGAGGIAATQRDLGGPPAATAPPKPLQAGPERWWAPFVFVGS